MLHQLFKCHSYIEIDRERVWLNICIWLFVGLKYICICLLLTWVRSVRVPFSVALLLEFALLHSLWAKWHPFVSVVLMFIFTWHIRPIPNPNAMPFHRLAIAFALKLLRIFSVNCLKFTWKAETNFSHVLSTHSFSAPSHVDSSFVHSFASISSFSLYANTNAETDCLPAWHIVYRFHLIHPPTYLSISMPGI